MEAGRGCGGERRGRGNDIEFSAPSEEARLKKGMKMLESHSGSESLRLASMGIYEVQAENQNLGEGCKGYGNQYTYTEDPHPV